MINLLPTDVKTNYVYARRNTKLRRWAFFCFLGIVGVGIVITGGLFYMNQSIHDYTTQKQKTQTVLDAQKLGATEKQVQDISGSLSLVVRVLSKEVLFSNLIKQIGAAMPANSSLTSLKIVQTTGGIDLSAVASDYSTASQVQVNLQDPANKIFNKADIVNISCSSTPPPGTRYPCTVAIRAQFAAINPFLFINSKATP